MNLSEPQRKMLYLLVEQHHSWRFHKDGRKAHGQGRSLASLQRKGLARFLYDPKLTEITGMPKENTEATCAVLGCYHTVVGPGWVVTDKGVEVWCELETVRRRPSREDAENAIREFLAEAYPELADEHIRMVEDGDGHDAPNKCGWAWWIYEDDTTSYVHEDLKIEWYGHNPPEDQPEG